MKHLLKLTTYAGKCVFSSSWVQWAVYNQMKFVKCAVQISYLNLAAWSDKKKGILEFPTHIFMITEIIGLGSTILYPFHACFWIGGRFFPPFSLLIPPTPLVYIYFFSGYLIFLISSWTLQRPSNVLSLIALDIEFWLDSSFIYLFFPTLGNTVPLPTGSHDFWF